MTISPKRHGARDPHVRLAPSGFSSVRDLRNARAGRRRMGVVSDEFDVAVHDVEALAEIEMLANLIVATSEHEGRLPDRQIDEILGVVPSCLGADGQRVDPTP